jgi:DNA-directed RNA polymerase subunit RPC12/RpoP
MTDQENTISKIRSLLDELEAEKREGDDSSFSHNFDALEVPSIVASIVDFLQPQLLPYEAAIYWHLFRKSILASGEQYARVSVRGMQQGVVTSSSGQTSSLSYSSVQDALSGLEKKGVIAKAGDTTREGTPYKVYIPDEIAICQQLKASMAAEQAGEKPIDARRELDYYNVLENRLKVFERDNYKCHYCQKQLTRFTATLDHIQPVSRGGDNSYENLVTACLHCNSRRGNRAVMDMYQENGAGNR